MCHLLCSATGDVVKVVYNNNNIYIYTPLPVSRGSLKLAPNYNIAARGYGITIRHKPGDCMHSNSSTLLDNT